MSAAVSAFVRITMSDECGGRSDRLIVAIRLTDGRTQFNAATDRRIGDRETNCQSSTRYIGLIVG